jgi:hypothetical protein
MVYLRVNTNRNNTITEISGDPFSGKTKGGEIFNYLNEGENQATTNYDFPTGQPSIFYRMNDLGDVEINDDDIVRSFYEEEGVLTGLDLEPHIEHAHDCEFIPSTTKIITIEGINFSPFTTMEISGDGNFVNTVYFDSPKKIRAEVTVGMEEGLFNITVFNDQLHSQSSGYGMLLVKAKTVVDLRTHDILSLGLEMSNKVEYEQDVNKGMRFYSNSSSWNRGVKFAGYSWNRNDSVTFEMIFTRTSDVLFMCGIAGINIDVDNLNSAYYKQEIGIYNNNSMFTTLYGGGDVSNWSQSIGTVVNIEKNKFYKIKLENSGGLNSNCGIYEVNVDDWDDETLIHSWLSSCVADDLILTPFVLPQAKNGDYYITGFRF